MHTDLAVLGLLVERLLEQDGAADVLSDACAHGRTHSGIIEKLIASSYTHTARMDTCAHAWRIRKGVGTRAQPMPALPTARATRRVRSAAARTGRGEKEVAVRAAVGAVVLQLDRLQTLADRALATRSGRRRSGGTARGRTSALVGGEDALARGADGLLLHAGRARSAERRQQAIAARAIAAAAKIGRRERAAIFSPVCPPRPSTHARAVPPHGKAVAGAYRGGAHLGGELDVLLDVHGGGGAERGGGTSERALRAAENCPLEL
jgi:hypothetical protein